MTVENENEYEMPDTKEQATIYIRTKILDKIEELRYFHRKKLPRAKRTKLTKSKFYELLIEAIAADDKMISKIISKWEQS